MNDGPQQFFLSPHSTPAISVSSANSSPANSISSAISSTPPQETAEMSSINPNAKLPPIAQFQGDPLKFGIFQARIESHLNASKLGKCIRKTHKTGETENWTEDEGYVAAGYINGYLGDDLVLLAKTELQGAGWDAYTLWKWLSEKYEGKASENDTKHQVVMGLLSVTQEDSTVAGFDACVQKLESGVKRPELLDFKPRDLLPTCLEMAVSEELEGTVEMCRITDKDWQGTVEKCRRKIGSKTASETRQAMFAKQNQRAAANAATNTQQPGREKKDRPKCTNPTCKTKWGHTIENCRSIGGGAYKPGADLARGAGNRQQQQQNPQPQMTGAQQEAGARKSNEQQQQQTTRQSIAPDVMVSAALSAFAD
jgi:hypothetical protein